MLNKSTRQSRLSLDDAKNWIRGSGNPIAALSEIRLKIRRSDLVELVKWLPSYRRNGRGLFPWQYPKNIADLRRQGVLEHVGIEKEITWAGHRLIQQATKITAFRALAQEFEITLTSRNYRDCPALLDRIENEFGMSLWVIENRIAILQLLEGIERQKAYATMIRNERGRNDLVSYIAFCTSHRNETTVTVSNYSNQIASALDSPAIRPEMRSYLLFHTTNRIPQDHQEISDILRYEDNSSIIDYYETFITCAKWALSAGIEEVRRLVIPALLLLSKTVSDHRIKKSLFIGGATKNLDELQPLPLEAHDIFATGQFEAVTYFTQS